MTVRRVSLFEAERLTMQESVELTAESLRAYGERYPHWSIAYSGGKDSTATVTVVIHLIETGAVPRPASLSIMYADTGMELPPLNVAALRVLDELRQRGYRAEVVKPPLDERFFVYMFGRGVPPPKNHFRWCTPQLKIEPMMAALQGLRDQVGQKLLALTGVRLGESAARDQRIAVSCSRDGAECGQGWFQEATPTAVADTLAPLLHWRVCHVWDWLMFEAPGMGFPTQMVAEAYGGDEAEEINARTGCVGCNLASRDTALEMLLGLEHWRYLEPLRRLRPLYAELTKAHSRLRKAGDQRLKDGSIPLNPMRMGPLTMDARRAGLATVLAIQDEISAAAAERPQVTLIDPAEHARILELIDANTWPNGWDGTEVRGDVLLPQVMENGSVQHLLLGLESEA
jgi:DNA sulfur modification protein DndC